MKYEAIIFDLDGVICSTDLYHYQAWKKLAQELDIEFNEKLNHKLRGVSRMDSLEIILKSANRKMEQKEKERLAEVKNTYYREYLQKMSPKDMSGDVRDTLEVLRKQHIKLAIASSSKNAKLILEKTGITNLFDAICDGNDISKSKPDPEVFLKAAEALQVIHTRCLVVEDAEAGVEAARQGGFDCAGIGEASKNGAVTYSLSKLSDILELF